MHLALDDQRVDHVADVVHADVLAQVDVPGLGVDLDAREVRAVREGEVLRVEHGVGVEAGLHVLRVVVRRERGPDDLLDGEALVGALDREAAVGELEVVLGRLQQVRRELLGLADHLLRRVDDGDAADDQRPRAVGVEALRRDLGVAVQDLDVLERHAELVGDDLAERRLVPLPVRGGAGDDLDLAGGQHPDRRGLPAARAVGQRAQQPRRGDPAHLGERRDADAELDRVAARAPLLLLAAQARVVERGHGLLRWPARSCPSRR